MEMLDARKKMTQWLFETGSLKVSKKDQPFWYTSGTIGPYFINTHYLFGNEILAGEFLEEINRYLKTSTNLPELILKKSRKQYAENRIYKEVINRLIQQISKKIRLENVDIVSGGERRDWFFSMMVADLLKKPHVSLFKNGEALLSEEGKIATKFGRDHLKGKKVLHIADLVTEASSYVGMWIPIIQSFGGTIKNTLVVVDRMQGGKEILKKQGVHLVSLLNVNRELFVNAKQMGLINEEQLIMLVDYLNDPQGSMQRFLEKHPDFLQQSLNADEKTKERAKRCINDRVYHI